MSIWVVEPSTFGCLSYGDLSPQYLLVIRRVSFLIKFLV